jgi:hypothetical protein
MCAEICTWAKALFADSDQYLEESYKEALKEMEPGSDADCQADYTRKIRLPCSTEISATRTVWLMKGFRLAKKIMPTSSGREATIVLKMISELRQKLAMNLSDSPSFCRKEVAVKESVTAKNTITESYLVIGGQEAADLSQAMLSQGITARAVVTENWKVNVDMISDLVEKTKAAMAADKPTMVIVCGMERSVYQVQTEEGYNLPLSRTKEGEVHVEGELAVCGKEAQVNLFKLMERSCSGPWPRTPSWWWCAPSSCSSQGAAVRRRTTSPTGHTRTMRTS